MLSSRLRCLMSRSTAVLMSTSAAGEVLDRSMALEFGSAMIPHPDKAEQGGEDASFASHSLNAFGLADGGQS
jgi:hypothetical protein